MSSLIQPELFFSALSPAEQRIQQALEDIRQGKPVLVDTTALLPISSTELKTK